MLKWPRCQGRYTRLVRFSVGSAGVMFSLWITGLGFPWVVFYLLSHMLTVNLVYKVLVTLMILFQRISVIARQIPIPCLKYYYDKDGLLVVT